MTLQQEETLDAVENLVDSGQHGRSQYARLHLEGGSQQLTKEAPPHSHLAQAPDESESTPEDPLCHQESVTACCLLCSALFLGRSRDAKESVDAKRNALADRRLGCLSSITLQNISSALASSEEYCKTVTCMVQCVVTQGQAVSGATCASLLHSLRLRRLVEARFHRIHE